MLFFFATSFFLLSQIFELHFRWTYSCEEWYWTYEKITESILIEATARCAHKNHMTDTIRCAFRNRTEYWLVLNWKHNSCCCWRLRFARLLINYRRIVFLCWINICAPQYGDGHTRLIYRVNVPNNAFFTFDHTHTARLCVVRSIISYHIEWRKKRCCYCLQYGSHFVDVVAAVAVECEIV